MHFGAFYFAQYPSVYQPIPINEFSLTIVKELPEDILIIKADPIDFTILE